MKQFLPIGFKQLPQQPPQEPVISKLKEQKSTPILKSSNLIDDLNSTVTASIQGDEISKLQRIIADLSEENRLIKVQMKEQMSSIAQIEEKFAEKQEQFMKWHQEEMDQSSISISQLSKQISELEIHKQVGNEEIVRLTNQLADTTDHMTHYKQLNSDLHRQMQEYQVKLDHLQHENDRLTLTIVQQAQEKTDLQSKLVMVEHDLETAKTRIFDMTRTIEGYKQQIADLERRLWLDKQVSSHAASPTGVSQKRRSVSLAVEQLSATQAMTESSMDSIALS